MGNQLIKELQYAANSILQKINYLLKTDKTIGIYGGGGYAYTLINELACYGIVPMYCVVDDQYYKSDKKCNEIPIISLNECNQKYKESIIVVGFGMSYDNEEDSLKRIRINIDDSIELIDFEDQYISYFPRISYDYILNNINEFQSTYEMLNDELSQKIMIEYFNCGMSGCFKKMHILKTDKDNDYDLALVFDNLKEGVIFECGAYDGKSAIQIMEHLGRKKTIYALEFDESNYNLMVNNINNIECIVPIKKGVWSNSGYVSIKGDGQSASVNCDNELGDVIEVISLDELAIDKKVGAILMDIEGSELDALKGAYNTIIRDKPALAIRVYHKKDDLINIPKYLNSLFDIKDRYDLYLRFNGMYRGAADLTLYAI